MAIPKRLADVVGQTLPFYGVIGHHFKLGRLVYHAEEDPSDGYRSSLRSCDAVTDFPATRFPRRPLAVVTVQATEHRRVEGWRLQDAGGHEWLVVGTDDSADYYPSFHFAYTPPRGGVRAVAGVDPADARDAALRAVLVRLVSHNAEAHGVRHCAECRDILAAARAALAL